ncbi:MULTISPECIES: hypothetical protein [unclassified Streptomyces]|uniref:hypothetical protein n=1 Tax=unclassified Streptomyces TaxID=2593676 RepID=UPI00190BBEFD|nr:MULTISPECIES: hypothetical protein [unclassified Streptomyces]MBK3569512.1 hypothetical protein [Streptomyces sp. MBT62]MBK6017991.1 hypothetical protein [Streptomyces sp. MBT53]
MVVLELRSALFTMGVDQLIQSLYGAPGLLALLLIGVGVKARSRSCAAVGAVVLMLLMTQA